MLPVTAVVLCKHAASADGNGFETWTCESCTTAAGKMHLDALQTPEHLKTETGEESFNPDGLAQRSIKLLKDTFPDIEVHVCSSLAGS